MSPRLQLLRACTRPQFSSKSTSLPIQSPIATFLAPILLRSGLLEQTRSASILSSISDTQGAYNKRIRVGRGPASGKGKTSGRGHKGQKQHGKVPRGFTGGQTPDEIVNPPRGKDNRTYRFTQEFAKVNVDRIQQWIDQGRLDPKKPITLRDLQRSRCTHGLKEGVKLLARNAGQLTTPINIIVSRASAGAIKAVEAAGGTISTRFYTKASLRRIMAGETDPINSLMSAFPPEIADLTSRPIIDAETGLKLTGWKYRLPDPTSRADIEYYRDPAHRGYLSHLVKDGESPSLFFRTAKAEQERKALGKQQAETPISETKLW
ncbi:ribosomal protein L15 [Pseudovirgaria hyperparasitica]|uniref:Ribosomal protein L15 n=1 Tax=Pseudovirgaria hyperparasitica TaxID=470096 RepID=A0A6A6W8X4_9PEZI|nr:ribosomal protein L15 [Pseudovirgaria hyperparasitica]KAF2759005.1 ribosomal protein L15 [Pseudovirgaria hyperparasitica]